MYKSCNTARRSHIPAEAQVMKPLGAFLFFLASFSIASAADQLVRFDGGIGAQPLRAVAPGVPATNDVIGTPPGGRPWVIERLTARVRADGAISVDGRGLLIAGGATVGTHNGQSVRARLFCG